MTVGDRIKEARKAVGLTQVEVAQRAEIAVNTLRLYEAGKREPRTGQLGLIASALGVPVSELMGLQDYGDGFHAEPGLEQTTVDAVKARISELKEETKRRQRMNNAFDRLNTVGQEKAVERVEELIEIPRYRREEAPEPGPPTPDTPLPADAPEGTEPGK